MKQLTHWPLLPNSDAVLPKEASCVLDLFGTQKILALLSSESKEWKRKPGLRLSRNLHHRRLDHLNKGRLLSWFCSEYSDSLSKPYCSTAWKSLTKLSRWLFFE